MCTVLPTYVVTIISIGVKFYLKSAEILENKFKTSVKISFLLYSTIRYLTLLKCCACVLSGPARWRCCWSPRSCWAGRSRTGPAETAQS